MVTERKEIRASVDEITLHALRDKAAVGIVEPGRHLVEALRLEPA